MFSQLSRSTTKTKTASKLSTIKNHNNNNVIILTQFGIDKLGCNNIDDNDDDYNDGINEKQKEKEKEKQKENDKIIGYRLYCRNQMNNNNKTKLFNSVSSDHCRTFNHRTKYDDYDDNYNSTSNIHSSSNSAKQENLNYTSKILKRHAIWSKSTSQYKKYIKKQHDKQLVQKRKDAQWPEISKIYKKSISNILEHCHKIAISYKNRSYQRLKIIHQQKYVNNNTNDNNNESCKYKSDHINGNRYGDVPGKEGFAERSFLVPRRSNVNYGNMSNKLNINNKFDQLQGQNMQIQKSKNKQEIQNKQNKINLRQIHDKCQINENSRSIIEKKSKVYYKMIKNRNQTEKY